MSPRSAKEQQLDSFASLIPYDSAFLGPTPTKDLGSYRIQYTVVSARYEIMLSVSSLYQLL